MMHLLQERKIISPGGQVCGPADFVDMGGVYEFYADEIGCVLPRGANFQMIFVVWEDHWERGAPEQIPRIIGRVTRPVASILRGEQGAIGQMLLTQRRKLLPMHG